MIAPSVNKQSAVPLGDAQYHGNFSPVL